MYEGFVYVEVEWVDVWGPSYRVLTQNPFSHFRDNSKCCDFRNLSCKRYAKIVHENGANLVPYHFFWRSLFKIFLVTVFLFLINAFGNVFIFAKFIGSFRGYFSFFLTLDVIGRAMKNERGVIGVLGPHLALFTYIPYICTEVLYTHL